ncbi:hypothetical protein AYI70_g11066 [Smittium culicis]|uniref:Uncharacterized protein n=1 Tax=Smittium culicis TaxID=133412 RepID=A0A1R1X3K6_9FUNG|nr:hypothetical protein AYI70_g11066 [Smittium culicis]
MDNESLRKNQLNIKKLTANELSSSSSSRGMNNSKIDKSSKEIEYIELDVDVGVKKKGDQKSIETNDNKRVGIKKRYKVAIIFLAHALDLFLAFRMDFSLRSWEQ